MKKTFKLLSIFFLTISWLVLYLFIHNSFAETINFALASKGMVKSFSSSPPYQSQPTSCINNGKVDGWFVTEGSKDTWMKYEFNQPCFINKTRFYTYWGDYRDCPKDVTLSFSDGSTVNISLVAITGWQEFSFPLREVTSIRWDVNSIHKSNTSGWDWMNYYEWEVSLEVNLSIVEPNANIYSSNPQLGISWKTDIPNLILDGANLYYSADNGRSWTSLASNIISTSYLWNLSSISKGDYRIKAEGKYNNETLTAIFPKIIRNNFPVSSFNLAGFSGTSGTVTNGGQRKYTFSEEYLLREIEVSCSRYVLYPISTEIIIQNSSNETKFNLPGDIFKIKAYVNNSNSPTNHTYTYTFNPPILAKSIEYKTLSYDNSICAWSGQAFFNITDFKIEGEDKVVTIVGNNNNQIPTLNFIGNKEIAEDSFLTFDLSASDPDGGSLTYSAFNLPTGAALTGQTFTWTPAFDQAQDYQLTFKVTDLDQASSEGTVLIKVTNTNRSPVLTKIESKTIKESTLLTFDLEASDPDGGSLTYSAFNLPTGAALTGQTFTWTPTFDQAQDYQLTFKVTDLDQASAEETVLIKVTNTNRSPVLTKIEPKEGEIYSKEINIKYYAYDQDDDSLSLSIFYSDDSGNSWKKVANSIKINSGAGEYLWNLEKGNIKDGLNYRLKLTVTDRPEQSFNGFSQTALLTKDFTIGNVISTRERLEIKKDFVQISISEDTFTENTEKAKLIVSSYQELNEEKKEKINQAITNTKNLNIRVNSTCEFNLFTQTNSEYQGNFSKPVVIKIPYPENIILDDGTLLKPEAFKIYRLDPDKLTWNLVPYQAKDFLDKENKLIKASLNHFSIYALGYSSPEISLLSPTKDSLSDQVWIGKRTIKWRADDKDLDSLCINVEMSNNQGKSWRRINEIKEEVIHQVREEGSNEGEISIDTRNYLDGGYLIKLTVSDGYLKNFVVSSPFIIDNYDLIPANKWAMISIPRNTPPVIVGSVFNQIDPNNIKVYRWLESEEEDAITLKYRSAKEFYPGIGYWIKVSQDTPEIKCQVEGNFVDLNLPYVVSLISGWNQIGNPFPYPVDWNKVQVVYEDNKLSLSQAVKKGLLASLPWDSKDSFNPQAISVLKPWHGCWIKAFSNCQIIIPNSPATNLPPSPMSISSLQGKDNWQIQLIATSKEHKDSNNYLGINTASCNDYDHQDLNEPPLVSPYLSLYFPHYEWKTNPGIYAFDTREPFKNFQSWNFVVSTDMPNEEITLFWENIDSVPTKYKIILHDGEKEIDLRTNKTLVFNSGKYGLKKSFTISIATKWYSETLKIKDLYNFPNPVTEGETTLVAEVYRPEEGVSVTYKIYSISGELITQGILEKGNPQKGNFNLSKEGTYFSTSWNCRNSAQKRVASGVYILIITAQYQNQKVSKSEKMAVVF
ncbi:MAG: Ig-like domain-containing protein [bacterium]